MAEDDFMNSIDDMYTELCGLFRKRDSINAMVAQKSAELRELVSPYYWDTNRSLFELSKIIGIPFNQIHLYAYPKTEHVKCCICGEDRDVTVESRTALSRLDNWTCNAECREKIMRRLYPEDYA
jgi:hypothetical protein